MKIIISIFFVIFLLGTLKAQWQQIGLNNLYISSIVSNGTNIFAGTAGNGVFISTNNGSTWSAINNGLTNDTILTLAIAGTNLFASTYSNGLFLSTNNGNSWSAVNIGFSPNNYVNSLSSISNNIYAGTNHGMYLSTNNGGLWTSINNGWIYNHPNDSAVTAIAVNGSSIYAGTWGGSMFISSNSGNNWTQINNGLNVNFIKAIAVSDTNLFVGGLTGLLYLSTNNGQNWAPANNGLVYYQNNDTAVTSIAFYGANIFVGTWYGGVFFSNNNGNNWIPVNSGLTYLSHWVNSLVIKDSYIYAATAYEGVWKRPLSEITDIAVNGKEFNFILSPNPATEKFQIELPNKYLMPESYLTICDINGRQLLNQQISSEKTEVNISSLSEGVYIVKVFCNENVFVKKLIIQ